jgi:hypothetical protein
MARVGACSNVKARLIRRSRYDLGEGETVHVRIWLLPTPVTGSADSLKYSFAFVCDEACVVRYDNERGKGDHRHIDREEFSYDFIDIRTLDRDFWRDVRDWRVQNGRL